MNKIMNDSAFLADFYGPTLLWFGPIFGLMGLMAVVGNALLIWIALSTPSIRSVNSHWFVISMGIADFLFGLNSSVLSGIAFICGGNGSCPALVKVCGSFSVSTIESAFVFPTFIVINRYLKITKLPSDSSRIRRFFLSSTAILLLTFLTWIYVIGISSILLIYDQTGEDFFGLYGARRFTSFRLYLVYMTAAVYAMSSYFGTYYFYGKLQKFVAENIRKIGVNRSTRQQQQRQENKETKAVLKMVKLSTLIPLISQGAAFALNGGQWFMPVDLVPMWCRRIIIVFFAIPPMCGPWLSILILGPFKREFKRLLGSIGIEFRRIPNANVSTAVMTAPQ